jgi:hypothetical protein
VTRVPQRNFGDGNERGRPVDERVARRVLESAPDLTGLPRRGGSPSGVAGGSGAGAGNTPAGGSGARGAVPRRIQLPDSPTGAAERTPGVALDEDLRRSRVFRGREPRPVEPVQTNTETSSTPINPSTPPGAVTRPEPRRPSRESERPRIETQSEPRTSDSPRPERRRIDPSPSESQPEPRRETPRSDSPPRIETPRSEPAPRVETPLVEPPRSESRPEPRREGPPHETPPHSESHR